MRITFSQLIELAHQGEYQAMVAHLDLFALWVLYETFGGHRELLELYFTSDAAHDLSHGSGEPIEAVRQVLLALEQEPEKWYKTLRSLTLETLGEEEWHLFARIANRLVKLSKDEARWLVYADTSSDDRSLAVLQQKALIHYKPPEHGWQVMLRLSKFAPSSYLAIIDI
jgi:hypothetical protein